MRDKLKDPARLLHIFEAATKLVEVTPKYSLETLQQDSIIFYGLVKLVEIIGEASYKLTPEFKQSHP